MGRSIRSLLLSFCLMTAILNPVSVLAEEAPAGDTAEEVLTEGESAEAPETETKGEESGEEPAPVSEGEELPEETVVPTEDPGTVISEPEEPVQPEEEIAQPEEEATPEETEVPEESSEEEAEPEEETEDAVLFEAPEGFTVAEADEAGKATLNEMNVLQNFSAMEEGKDYASRELMFLADDRAYAEQVAEIYHAELTSFEHGVAVITITDPDITVEDVFKVALDSDFELPLVEPNYITYLDPIEEGPSVVIDEGDGELFSDSLPEVLGWSEWVNDVFGANADEAIKTPSDENFQWQHTALNTYAGWNATMGEGITVAVIDQGINTSHEDFDGRVTVDNVTGDSTLSGHGNHVAGIVGASVRNAKGGAGVAPEANILGINVFTQSEDEQGRISISAAHADVIKGLDIAIEHDVDIVNMSLGSYAYSENYNRKIDEAYRAGIVICASAGNENTNSKPYPAGYNHVISVAAVNRNGAKAGYSNFGSWVTIAAPGSGIYSVYSQDSYPGKGGYQSNDAYEKMDGTSMACPVVSGALALYMSKFGHKNYDEIIKVLKTSTNKSSSSGMGYGIISVEKLFNKKETAPAISVYDVYDKPVTDFKNPLSSGSYIYLNISDENREIGKNETILYTTDGKNPAVKNGQIVNGTVYDGYPIIVDDVFAKGSTITLKATVVNELGVAGAIKTLKFKTPAIIPATVKVKTVAFETTKVTLKYSTESDSEPFAIAIRTLKDTQGEDKDILLYEHTWTSSNEKVATVDGYGNVTATGPGTAKITLKLLDGSKKSAVCTVTVNQLPESVVIKGQEGMAAGTSATFSATVLPATTKNKKVTWELIGYVPEGVKLKGSKVTVAKTVSPDAEFTLKATSVEDPAKYGVIHVKVMKKASAIKLDTDYNSERIKRNAKGVLTTVNLFTTDIDDSFNPGDDSAFQLNASLPNGENDIPPVFTSSNPKVATVTSDGYVQAVGKGTTKITATANDGSKKKATVTVKVSVPISNLSIDIGENYFLCAGKSLNLKDNAMFGTQYGVPGSKSVKWSISKVEYTTYKIDPETQRFVPDVTHDMTSGVLKNKWAYIAGNSKLTVAKKIQNYLNVKDFDVKIYLRADATDGTGYYYDQYEHGECIYVHAPQGSVIFDDYYGTGWGFDYERFVIGGDYGAEQTPIGYLFATEYTNFQITSSNPNVVSASYEYIGHYEDIWIYQKGRPKKVTGYLYQVTLFGNPKKKGTATLTAKALDGSGKSAKVKVRVW